MSRIRALVVDDSVVVRKLLTDTLSGDPDIEVAGAAANGKIGLAKIRQVNPDVVTLDVEMPELDGLATLRALRESWPRLPVIMFSTLTERGAAATLEALSLGASDYVTKPANVGSVQEAISRIRDELIPKVKALVRGHGRPTGLPMSPPLRTRIARPQNTPVQLVVIACSTGGPNALTEVIPRLPGDFSVPVAIVQHMPPVFTKSLADRLSAKSPLRVSEASDGDALEPGGVWIAPGDYHIEVERHNGRAMIRTHQGPPENSCRPAADVLFRSAAVQYGPNTLAVVLTGMGQDGLRGCEQIHEAGGLVYVQDEATSVVWGMPGQVAHAGLADKILPLNQIAHEIHRRVSMAPM